MKAQTPDNPELGCSGSGRPLCRQEMTPWTRDKLERGNQGPQKDQEPFAGTARSVQVVSSSITPCVLGLSPREPSHEPQAGWETLLPTSFPPSTIHHLPGHRCPPPPATSDSPRLPRVQEQRVFYRRVEANTSWGDAAPGVGHGKKDTQTGDKRAIRSLENKELVIMKKGQIS